MDIKDSLDILRMPSTENEVLLILISVLVGLVIGADREYQNKSAGLRTFILVSFGSCIFTILSLKIGVDNPDRLAANIITGIGFLGAGVIFKDDNKIGGITTATTIWATASLGMAVGSGHIYLALLGTFLVMLILRILLFLQNIIDSNNKIRDYKITTSVNDYEYCQMLFRKTDLKQEIIRQQYGKDSISTTWRLTGKLSKHQQLVEILMKDEKINAYQF
ncbi:MgtC/SapB family protein [Chryseobacterium sp. POL2]|uniref:MgtC/SapB family protein n=1 Tax=Chryseobacterium sp. POL2 TaxID=2713414 RepID=UPI0013E1C7AC|nr:MgtC/SapB family protein [Chryseobacterium sp. POL2]QIG88272.1 MgtC/SapB family protein [Chryseobacterium sp. POL2]